jgi:hypothetical protein
MALTYRGFITADSSMCTHAPHQAALKAQVAAAVIAYELQRDAYGRDVGVT